MNDVYESNNPFKGFSFDFCNVIKYFVYAVALVFAVMVGAIAFFFMAGVTFGLGAIAFGSVIWAGNMFFISFSQNELIMVSVLMVIGVVTMIISIFSGGSGGGSKQDEGM